MFFNVIFDFDGVIINSHDVQTIALAESYKRVCGEGEPPYEEFFLLSGNSLHNIFTQLCLPLEMIPIYQKVSRENICRIKLFKGMPDLIKDLKENGFSCALCTGKDRSRTMEILQYFNIEFLFESIICSDDVKHPKPDPESLQIIIDRLSIMKKETIMVGDGLNDIIAAQRAKITSVAVTWGDVPRKKLMQAKPHYIVDSVTELRNLLL